jgi:hypothetical protein
MAAQLMYSVRNYILDTKDNDNKCKPIEEMSVEDIIKFVNQN